VKRSRTSDTAQAYGSADAVPGGGVRAADRDRWDEQRVCDAIRRIVADVDSAFDPDALWPADEWDGWQVPTPLKNLYVGGREVELTLLEYVRRNDDSEADELLLRGRDASVADLGLARGCEGHGAAGTRTRERGADELAEEGRRPGRA
jgi:hypothetical protein